jgi:hypothetical protein
VLEFCIKGQENEEQMGVLEELGRSQREIFMELDSKMDILSDRLTGLEAESRKEAASRAEVASHAQQVQMVASRLDRCQAASHDETTSRAEATSRVDAELEGIASRLDSLEQVCNANAARRDESAGHAIAPSSAETPTLASDVYDGDDSDRSSPNLDTPFEADAADATTWPDIVLEPTLTENIRFSPPTTWPDIVLEPTLTENIRFSPPKSVARSYPTCDLPTATSRATDDGIATTKRCKRPLRHHEGEHALHRDSVLPPPAVLPRPAAANTLPTDSESHSVPACNVRVVASSKGRLHARASGARRFRQAHARVASLGPTSQQEANTSQEDGEFRALEDWNLEVDTSREARDFRALQDWNMEMGNDPSLEGREFRALQRWYMGTQEPEKDLIKDPASSCSLLRACVSDSRSPCVPAEFVSSKGVLYSAC